uniref:Ig-like domain-containing protein n=1 Tax=Anabas testudineus TaxID=64144 RepID=A0A3Q1JJE8_ANATE
MGTEHRNLTWTPMLLLLTGKSNISSSSKWKVEYGQRNICAIKGSSVVIPCSFYYPKKQEVQSVKWAHGRSHIYKGPFIYDSESNYTSSRYQYIGDTQHNCSFKIHQVERNDSGKHAFRFSTISNNDLQEWTGSVGSQLKVVDLKVSMTKTNGSETIKEGDSVSLKCRNGCDVGGLSSSFTWFKNGEPINDGPILNLSNISSTNSGNYSCSLTTQRGLPSGVINIDAEYGPKNTSVSVRPSAQIHIGSSVSLICSTNANPTAEHYTWFKRSHDDDVIVGNGPELNFREIQPHDGGQYLCSVINKHGRQNSSIVTIKVKGNSASSYFLPPSNREYLCCTKRVCKHVKHVNKSKSLIPC